MQDMLALVGPVQLGPRRRTCIIRREVGQNSSVTQRFTIASLLVSRALHASVASDTITHRHQLTDSLCIFEGREASLTACKVSHYVNIRLHEAAIECFPAAGSFFTI